MDFSFDELTTFIIRLMMVALIFTFSLSWLIASMGSIYHLWYIKAQSNAIQNAAMLSALENGSAVITIALPPQTSFTQSWFGSMLWGVRTPLTDVFYTPSASSHAVAYWFYLFKRTAEGIPGAGVFTGWEGAFINAEHSVAGLFARKFYYPMLIPFERGYSAPLNNPRNEEVREMMVMINNTGDALHLKIIKENYYGGVPGPVGGG